MKSASQHQFSPDLMFICADSPDLKDCDNGPRKIWQAAHRRQRSSTDKPPAPEQHRVISRGTAVRRGLRLCVLALFVGLPLAFAGCSDGPEKVYLSMGTAPIGGAFQVVGGAIAEVLNDHRDEINWKLQANGTKGSQENIRKLISGEIEFGLSNSAISYCAVRGESGWEKKHDIRAIVTLAPNVAMFITKQDSGIKQITDLKGKRVVVGPSGAGFEMFIKPLIAEHNVTYEDFDELHDTQSGAVGLLADGSADAAFLGGAVPTGSITQACSTHEIYFVPFDTDARQKLVESYPFFQPITVTADKYSDLTEDFPALNVGSMHLITSADQDEELIYQITKAIWENREEIARKHPAGKAINEKNAARYTGTDFHQGAIRFYKEIGIWPEATQEESAETPEESKGGDPADLGDTETKEVDQDTQKPEKSN